MGTGDTLELHDSSSPPRRTLLRIPVADRRQASTICFALPLRTLSGWFDAEDASGKLSAVVGHAGTHPKPGKIVRKSSEEIER